MKAKNLQLLFIGMMSLAFETKSQSTFQAIDDCKTGTAIGIVDSSVFPAGVNFAGAADLTSPLIVGVVKLGDFKGVHVGAMSNPEKATGYSYIANDTSSLLNQNKLIVQSPTYDLFFKITKLPVFYSNEQAWSFYLETGIMYWKPDGTIALTYDPDYPLQPY